MKTTGRLDSWKEIAQYVGRDVSTAIRWERERGLPVHRVPGPKRGSVYALTHEIDRWIAGSEAAPRDTVPPAGVPAQAPALDEMPVLPVAPAPAPWRRGPIWVVAVFVLVAGIGSLAIAARSRAGRGAPAAVAQLAFSGTELRALSAEGRLLWSHDFGRPVVPRVDPPPSCASQTFDSGDIDGDGRPELVASVAFAGDGREAPTTHDELFAFSATGRLLWSRQLDDELRFRAGRYGPPWIDPGVGVSMGRTVQVFEVGGVRRIAWAQIHHIWWPSVLSVLDGDGHVVSKWVHAGAIYTVLPRSSPDGPRLLVGGISNARESAFLAVLDARQVTGSDPEDAGSPFECLSCEPGMPLRYLSFAPSELMLATFPYNHVYDLRPNAGGVEVHTVEAPPDTPFKVQAIMTFSDASVLEHASWSSGWDNRHRELEEQGRLHHAVRDCPVRGGRPRVKEWTPDGGWRELTPTDALASTLTARR